MQSGTSTRAFCLFLRRPRDSPIHVQRQDVCGDRPVRLRRIDSALNITKVLIPCMLEACSIATRAINIGEKALSSKNRSAPLHVKHEGSGQVKLQYQLARRRQ